MTHKINIGKLSEYLNETLDNTARAIKIKVFTECVKNTIVDTGRLRGNWYPREGHPSNQSSEATGSAGEMQQRSVSRVLQHVNSTKAGGQTWLTNNLPYATVINNRDKIVEKAVDVIKKDVQSLVDEAAKKAAKGK